MIKMLQYKMYPAGELAVLRQLLFFFCSKTFILYCCLYDILLTLQVPIFARTNQHFHVPSDSTTPVIMIGPGTGVAPFVGFLKHRSALRETTPDRVLGDTWLFYGCRHKDRDYLYRYNSLPYLT